MHSGITIALAAMAASLASAAPMSASGITTEGINTTKVVASAPTGTDVAQSVETEDIDVFNVPEMRFPNHKHPKVEATGTEVAQPVETNVIDVFNVPEMRFPNHKHPKVEATGTEVAQPVETELIDVFNVPEMRFPNHKHPKVEPTGTTSSMPPMETNDDDDVYSVPEMFFGGRTRPSTAHVSIISTMSTIATSAPQPTKTEESSPTPDATKPPLYRVCRDGVCRSPTPEEKKEMDIEWNKVDWNWMPKHLKDYMDSMETATTTADAPTPTPTGLEKRGKIDQNWKGRWDEKWSDGIERYQSDRSKPIDFSLLPECLRYCFNKFNKHAPGDIFKESVGDFCGMPKLAVWNTWFDFGPGYCVSEKGRCSNYDSAMSRDWYFKNCGH